MNSSRPSIISDIVEEKTSSSQRLNNLCCPTTSSPSLCPSLKMDRCCFVLSLKTGGVLVAVSRTIALLCYLAYILIKDLVVYNTSRNLELDVLVSVCVVLFVSAELLLLLGVVKERTSLIVLWLLYALVPLAITCFVLLLFVSSVAASEKATPLLELSLLVGVVVLQLYTYLVVFSVFKPMWLSPETHVSRMESYEEDRVCCDTACFTCILKC